MGSTAATMALQVGLDYVMKSQQAKASNRTAQAQANARTAAINRAREIEERKKREALKRISATQRANFAARGTGGRGGSAEAVLSGLAKPYESDIENSRLIANDQISQIQNNLNHSKRVNLLEASSPVRQFLYNNLRKQLPKIGSLLD
jgi:hypothetical protein